MSTTESSKTSTLGQKIDALLNPLYEESDQHRRNIDLGRAKIAELESGITQSLKILQQIEGRMVAVLHSLASEEPILAAAFGDNAAKKSDPATPTAGATPDAQATAGPEVETQPPAVSLSLQAGPPPAQDPAKPAQAPAPDAVPDPPSAPAPPQAPKAASPKPEQASQPAPAAEPVPPKPAAAATTKPDEDEDPMVAQVAALLASAENPGSNPAPAAPDTPSPSASGNLSEAASKAKAAAEKLRQQANTPPRPRAQGT
ncbi:MAG: hypothetical protein AAGH88_06625 [Planctomycetota bacterium]